MKNFLLDMIIFESKITFASKEIKHNFIMCSYMFGIDVTFCKFMIETSNYSAVLLEKKFKIYQNVI
jgi:hypothetical protein